MVNIVELYTAVAVLCLTGAVPGDVVFRLLTSGIIAFLNLLRVAG